MKHFKRALRCSKCGWTNRVPKKQNAVYRQINKGKMKYSIKKDNEWSCERCGTSHPIEPTKGVQ
jgi:DNA-directed RNA polymerase subunit RPC12/RpoP